MRLWTKRTFCDEIGKAIISAIAPPAVLVNYGDHHRVARRLRLSVLAVRSIRGRALWRILARLSNGHLLIFCALFDQPLFLGGNLETVERRRHA